MTDLVRSSDALVRSLPDRPNLEHLRNEAKAKLKFLRVIDPSAQLAAAQRDVARGYGFQSWRRLRAEVAMLSRVRASETAQEKIERLAIDQARPREKVAIDPDALDRYVGFYELNAKTIITVQREGDELIARLTGQMFWSLVPEGQDKFFYKNSNIRAQLCFFGSLTERAASATLHQHGFERTALRVDEERATAVEYLREERRIANKPFYGSEKALRRMIDQNRNGSPDYEMMSKGLAEAFNEQLPDSRRLLNSLGDLISVEFIGVSPVDDSDVYAVRFSEAQTEWRLSMDGSDKIDSASFRVVP